MQFLYGRTKAGCYVTIHENDGVMFADCAGKRIATFPHDTPPEDAWLAAWAAQMDVRPFTIMRRINHKYRAGPLSFVPFGRDVVKITGRNGSYSVKYA